jgi:hypothetical protein
MKRHVGFLLSTISTAAVTAVLGLPAAAAVAPSDEGRPPIERLASIRSAYLSQLAGEAAWDLQAGDQVAQFRNFPNFPNFPNFSNWRNR